MLLRPFNKYPGTDYETYNWEWLIDIGKKMEKALSDLFSNTGALHQMVDNVLDEHPEWTTTVMDHSLEPVKFTSNTWQQIVNGSVSPDMFGAVGDGAADDTDAIQEAVNSGKYIDLLGKTYKITGAIVINDNVIYNGNLKMASNSTITAEDLSLYDIDFDFTEYTADTQIPIKLVDGKNSINNCNFGSMVAENLCIQLDIKDCIADVQNSSFAINRVTTVNESIGDEIGVARHIRAVNSEILISNNQFEGFYGGDTKYLHDSDCIHTSNCSVSNITNNRFSGYWKSAIKNQYDNTNVTGNIFESVAGHYIFRSHESSKNVVFTNNIINGRCDQCFLLDGEKIELVNNTVTVSAVELLLSRYQSNVIFNDNIVEISTPNDWITQPGNTLTPIVFSIDGGSIESNSDIKAGNHQPYEFRNPAQTNIVTCNLTGHIHTTYEAPASPGYILSYVTGIINFFTDINVLITRGTGLTVTGNSRVNFTNCSNVKADLVLSDRINVRQCSNMKIDIVYNKSDYAVRIGASTNIVINIYGVLIGNMIIFVEDGTSTGVAVNYISTAVGINALAGYTVIFKTKSMMA